MNDLDRAEFCRHHGELHPAAFGALTLQLAALHSWSDELISQNRTAIDDCFVSPDGYLHFKNINHSFGKICVTKLLDGKWIIEGKQAGSETVFETIDALIAAGWAID